MKEMLKSKTIIGFALFVFGMVYINTPKANLNESEHEIAQTNIPQTHYNA